MEFTCSCSRAAYLAAEQYGYGGLLIIKCWLLKKNACKLSMSTLLATDGSKLTRDYDKLQHRVDQRLAL